MQVLSKITIFEAGSEINSIKNISILFLMGLHSKQMGEYTSILQNMLDFGEIITSSFYLLPPFPNFACLFSTILVKIFGTEKGNQAKLDWSRKL